MKYTKPTYKKEAVETNDILLVSSATDLGNGITMIQKDQNTAQVSASINDVLGTR